MTTYFSLPEAAWTVHTNLCISRFLDQLSPGLYPTNSLGGRVTSANFVVESGVNNLRSWSKGIAIATHQGSDSRQERHQLFPFRSELPAART